MAEVGSAATGVLLKKDGVPANESRAITLESIYNLSHKEYAKKKYTVGIDAQKESNVVALAFEGYAALARLWEDLR